jgi:NAD(P)-dependent dehydrogenase (short-subunit alcohol dehydrogenase family)
MDLRTATNNELITAEHVDLSSLHSIRVFATKWVDNAPPRRLDMIILCANSMTPPGGNVESTEDGLESNWGINYMSNFHLLSILSPALRAQPPDRDVRVVFGICSSYMGGTLPDDSNPKTGTAKAATKKASSPSTISSSSHTRETIRFSPSSAYATSKLALMTFAMSFQKHLSTYVRPDKQPMNARVLLVDPGFTRTPGMRRYLTFGSLWGLLLYLVMWPLWWLVLKSPQQGAQTFLYAAMEARFGRGEGGRLLKECQEVKIMRGEVLDERIQKRLWEGSEKTVEALEKEGALRRAKEKKKKEEKGDGGKIGLEKVVEEEDEGRSTASPVQKVPGSRRSRKAA